MCIRVKKGKKRAFLVRCLKSGSFGGYSAWYKSSVNVVYTFC